MVQDHFDMQQILPPEILFEIFEYLSVDDRKSARLVCSEWKDICNRSRFISGEELRLKKFMNKKRFFDTLITSERKFFYLALEGITIDADDLQFWSKTGMKIRSVHFQKCSFGEGVLASIVAECPGLLHLKIWNLEGSQFLFDELFINNVLKCKGLKEISLWTDTAVPEEFVRKLAQLPRLVSLGLRFYVDSPTNTYLDTVMSTLPNLRELVIDGGLHKMTPEAFVKLVRSQLSFVRLTIVIGENFVVDKTLKRNVTVEELNLVARSYHRDLSVPKLFRKYFGNLNNLIVCC